MIISSVDSLYVQPDLTTTHVVSVRHSFMIGILAFTLCVLSCLNDLKGIPCGARGDLIHWQSQ